MCDVDGFTSASIEYLYIKSIFPDANLEYRIHQGKQHGLEDMMDELETEANADLIILPDASSNEEELHFRLKDIGIPVLVQDHHNASEYSQNAIVINNQLSQNYKNKALTGAGVVYQFCRYLDRMYGVNNADDYIDLAALGIISDMGSVLDPENAYIIDKGLKKQWKNFLFQTLLDKQAFSIGSTLNPISISFYITPLINALIRVGTMEEKTKLFEAFIDGHRIVASTKRGEKGMQEALAVQVARDCTNARTHQNKALDAALEQISFRIEDDGSLNNKILIVELQEEDTLPSTINGLLAMKICAKYRKPTIVVRRNSEDVLRGSLRGPSGSLFKDFRGYLESTGLCEYALGHAMAAGTGFKASKVQKLIEKANQDLSEYDFGQTYYEVNFERDVNSEDIKDIIFDIDKYKTTFGQENSEPLIAIRNLGFSKSSMSIMGKNKDTIKIESNGIAYMIFKATDAIKRIEEAPFDYVTMTIVGKANINEWGGKRSPQIFIEDFEIVNQLEF